jgi:hypothetical protein
VWISDAYEGRRSGKEGQIGCRGGQDSQELQRRSAGLSPDMSPNHWQGLLGDKQPLATGHWGNAGPGQRPLSRGSLCRPAPSTSKDSTRARALRRLKLRRSSSDRPPQTPVSAPDSMAHLRQVSTTSQRRQMAFASSIWTSEGPVLPIGKNSSGSSPRHVARFRHVISNQASWIVVWKSGSCQSSSDAVICKGRAHSRNGGCHFSSSRLSCGSSEFDVSEDLKHQGSLGHTNRH